MEEDYLDKLYGWINSKDNSFADRYTVDQFKENMQGDDYATKMHSWISSKDPSFSERRPIESFLQTVKKKETPTQDPQVLSETSNKPVEQAYEEYPTTFQTESTSVSDGSESVSSSGRKAYTADDFLGRKVSTGTGQFREMTEEERIEAAKNANKVAGFKVEDTEERPYAMEMTPEELEESKIQKERFEEEVRKESAPYVAKLTDFSEKIDLDEGNASTYVSPEEADIQHRRVELASYLENDFDWNSINVEGLESLEDYAFHQDPSPEVKEGVERTLLGSIMDDLGTNFRNVTPDLEAVTDFLRKRAVEKNKEESKAQYIADIEKQSKEEGVTMQDAISQSLKDVSDHYLDEEGKNLRDVNIKIRKAQLNLNKKLAQLEQGLEDPNDRDILETDIEEARENLATLQKQREAIIPEEELWFDSNYNVVDKDKHDPETTSEMRAFNNEVKALLASNDKNKLIERMMDLNAGVEFYLDKSNKLKDVRGHSAMSSVANKEFQSLNTRLRNLSKLVAAERDPSKLESQFWWEFADGWMSGMGFEDTVETHRKQVSSVIRDLSEVGVIREEDIERAKGTFEEKVGFGTGMAAETVAEMALESVVSEGIGAPAAFARGMNKLRKVMGIAEDAKTFAKMSGRLYEEARMIGYHGVSPGTMIIEGATEDLLEKIGANALLNKNFGKWGFAFKLPVKAAAMTVPEITGEFMLEGDLTADGLASTYLLMLGMGAISKGGIGGKSAVESEIEFLAELEERGADPELIQTIKDNSPYSPERKEDAPDLPEGTISEQELREEVEKAKTSVDVEQVKAEEKPPAPTTGELIGKRVTYKGQKGYVYEEGARVEFETDEGKIYELGSTEEVASKSSEELGLVEELPEIEATGENTFNIRGKEYANNYSDPTQAVNRNEEGDVISVNLETSKGEKRTFKGQVAQDLAYEIEMSQTNQEAFNEYLETNEQARAEIEQHEAKVQPIAEPTKAETPKTVQEPTVEAEVTPETKPKVELEKTFAEEEERRVQIKTEKDELYEATPDEVLDVAYGKTTDDPELQKAADDYLAAVSDIDKKYAAEGKEAVSIKKDNTYDLDNIIEEAPTEQQAALKPVENVVKALTGIDPDTEVVIHRDESTYEDAVDDAGGEAKQAKSSGFYMDADGKIHINLNRAQDTTAFHEAAHKVMEAYIRKSPNAKKKFYNELQKALPKDSVESLKDFTKGYEGVETKQEEFVVEALARIANGDIELKPSVLRKVRELLKKLAKMIGLNPDQIKLTGKEDVQAFADKLSKAFREGKEISISEDIAEVQRVAESVAKFQANYSDIDTRMTFTYDKNGKKFKELEKEGFITKDKSLSDFDGKYIFLHQPDGAFAGEIYKGGDLLIEGKGGVYYPIKFHEDGYFWASTGTMAKKMAKDLNKAAAKNDGKLYMALTTAPKDKLLSSTTASNGVLDLFLSKAFDEKLNVPKSKVKRSLLSAAKSVATINGKKVGLGLKGLTKDNSIEEITSAIRAELAPDKSSFASRKHFVSELAGAIAKNVTSRKGIDQLVDFFGEGIMFKGFKGRTTRKISKANMMRGLSEMLTEPMLKAEEDKGGKVYAILELEGKPGQEVVQAVESDKHESYPMAIQSVNPEAKTKLHILNDRNNWNESFEDPATGEIVAKDREKRIYPTSGVSVEALKLSSKPKFQKADTSLENLKAIPEQSLEKAKATYDSAIESKMTHEQAVEQVLEQVAAEPWFQNLSRHEQRILSNDIRNSIGEISRPKKAPTAKQKKVMKKVSKKPVGEKKTIDTWKQFKKELKIAERASKLGARTGKKEIAEMRQEVNDWLKENASALNKLAPKLSSALIRKLNNATTPRGIQKAIEHIEKVMTKEKARKKAAAEQAAYEKIHSQVDPKKYTTRDFGNVKGKNITADVQDFLAKVREAMSLSPEKAWEKQNKILDDLEARAKKDPNAELTVEEQLEHAALEFANLETMSLDELKARSALLEDVIKNGKEMRKEADAKYHEKLQETKAESARRFGGSRKKGLGTKERDSVLRKVKQSFSTVFNWSEAWKGLIEQVDRSGMKKYGLKGLGLDFTKKVFVEPIRKASQAFDAGIIKRTDEMQSKRKEIWGTKRGGKLFKPAWERAVRENKAATVQLKSKDASGNEIAPMSPNQIAYLYSVMKDDTMEATLEKQGITPEIIQEVNDYMDSNPQLKEYSDWIMDEYLPNQYKEINDVYRKMYKISLPFTSNYIPIKRVAGDEPEMSMFSYSRNPATVLNGSLKERVKNTNPIEFQDIESVALSYATNMEHFKAYAEPIRDISRVLGSKEVKEAIIDNNGKKMYEFIYQRTLGDITRGGVDAANHVNLMGKIRGHVVTATLGSNPVTMFKQLTSFPAYATEMNSAEFALETTKMLGNMATLGSMDKFMGTDYGKAYRHIMESAFMKDRYDKGFDRDMAAAMKNLDPARKPNLASKLMVLTKLGDKGAIVMGGVPFYHAQYKKAKKNGMSEQAARDFALDRFIEATENAQQSTKIENLSSLQRGGEFVKLFTMYKTSQRQYLAHTRAAIRNISRGRGSVYDYKKLIMYNVTLPALFTTVANAGWRAVQAALGEEDDTEPLKELGKDISQSIATTNLQGVLFAGDVLNAMGNRWWRGRPWQYSIPVVKDINQSLLDPQKRVQKAGGWSQMGFEDYYNTLAPAGEDITGIPLRNIKKISYDSWQQPNWMVEDFMGWSPYVMDTYRPGGGKSKSKPKPGTRRGSTRGKAKRLSANR